MLIRLKLVATSVNLKVLLTHKKGRYLLAFAPEIMVFKYHRTP